MLRALLKKALMAIFLPADIRYSLSLLDQINSYRATQVIYVAAKLGIPDILKTGGCSVESLAEKTQSNVDALYRLLRALAGLGIVQEVQPQYFSLTAQGQILQKDHPRSLRDVALLNGESWNWNTWGQLEESVKTGEPVFEKIYDCSFNFCFGNFITTRTSP
jgi:hypothetical protein